MSKLSTAEIEALRARYPITAIAGDWVRLRAQRQGEFSHSGPCPLHSPDPLAADSTSFACNDLEWACARGCGRGDVFRLVALRHGIDPKADFRKAVELLTGGAAAPQLSAEEQLALEQAAAERRQHAQAEQNEYRDRERAAAYDQYFGRDGVWQTYRLSHPLAQPARRYLRELRGLDFPADVRLRFNPAARFYQRDKPKPRLLHTGPALLAMIQRAGRFAGVHMTFLDLERPKGKAVILDPKYPDAVISPKKMRGSKKGGHIDLTGVILQQDGRERPDGPRELFLGEGIEKVLAVWTAYAAAGRDLSRTAFWVAGDEGNLAGKHKERVPHPVLKTASGRVQTVGGPLPDFDSPAIAIPDSVERLVTLIDTTSDLFTSACVAARARARYEGEREARRQRGEALPKLKVVAAMAPEGVDFDDMLLVAEPERSEGGEAR